MTTRVEQKLKDYENSVLMGIDFLSQGLMEESAVRFRKTAEAYMKIIVYEHWGEDRGYLYLTGLEDQNGVPSSVHMTPLFNSMLRLCYDENHWIDVNIYNYLNEIRMKCSEQAHDSNEPLSDAVLRSRLEDSILLSEKLTQDLYARVGRSVPSHLISAYSNGVVDSLTISEIRQHDFESFMEDVEGFDRSNRYILVAPFKTDNYSKNLLRNLMGVRWSLVVDFNCHTKEPGGLYNSMLPEIDDNCTPFTILNKDGLVNMSKGTSGNVNWIYANGISSVAGTVTSDIRAWIGKRMHHFLRDALTEFCRKSVAHIYIISLLDDEEYITEVIHQFDNIDFAERDLVSFRIISEREEVRTNMQNLTLYGFDIRCYNFTISHFLSEIGDFLRPEERHTVLVPGRSVQGESFLADITSIYSKFTSNGISVIHKDIVTEGDTDILQVPSFYRGETITWKELEADVDVQRFKYEEFRRKIVERLNGRQSQKFILYHYAGAGGTTLSRRLAYDLREVAPTIIINEYNKSTTYGLIELLSMKVNRPILAIVESTKVGNIDELIAQCNSKKRIVVFVYVERTLSKQTPQSQTEFISDKMHDAEEKGKFQYKVKLYNPESSSLQWIDKSPFVSCEVIDFSMSIVEKDYDRKRLRGYIQNYMNQLSEPTIEFLTYVSIIYHYAQRSVSDLVFRKLFTTTNGKTGFRPYMRQRPQEFIYLKKLLTTDGDEYREDRQWHPRYSVFADIILEEALGGQYPDHWKIALPLWSRKLIETVKNNYDFLNDEEEKMLTAVFLERENEDLLGHEEVWGARGAQEKFSQLLDDMSYSPDDQKGILKCLADNYPSISHFWGHLARYCYENADTPEQFNEALGYIDKALDKNGRNDFNLLHIAGMCRRRQIEYYHRHQINVGRDELKTLTEASQEFFHQSRAVNPRNVHAYMSEIQLLTLVIEYGKSFSDSDGYNTFLLTPSNRWYFDLYEQLNDLIDELSMLLNQIKTLGVTNRILRTRTMLAHSESKSWEYMGDYKASLHALQNHIQQADRLSLPRLRMMYVRTLLLSKVDGKNEHMIEAWKELSDAEVQLMEDYLNKNVQQDSGNVGSMRLWMQLVRYSGVLIPIEEVKSRLKMMFKNSDDYPITKMEAAFNLYILNLFELIRDNDFMNSRKKDEIKMWVDECRKLSPSDKYPFEWLVHLNDLSGIINSRDKKDDTQFVRVRGTITDIKSHAQGTIRLDCGYDVFFTPNVGGFIQGKDETVRVEMVIGFRHEGPAAYEVTREGVAPVNAIAEVQTESNHETEIVEIETIGPEVKKKVKEEDQSMQSSRLQVKILGKIDLSQFDKYERPRKKQKNL